MNLAEMEMHGSPRLFTCGTEAGAFCQKSRDRLEGLSSLQHGVLIDSRQLLRHCLKRDNSLRKKIKAECLVSTLLPLAKIYGMLLLYEQCSCYHVGHAPSLKQ